MATATTDLTVVPLSALKLDPANPRESIDPDRIDELAASILEHGILQPLLVRSDGTRDGYWVIAGQRRMIAAAQAGLEEVPIHVRESNGSAGIVAIVENLQREDLTPVEQAAAFQRALDGDMTIPDLAKALSISEQLVRDRLALLELPADTQTRIGTGGLTLRAAAGLKTLAAAGEAVVDGAAEIIANEILVGGYQKRKLTADDLENDPAGVFEEVVRLLQEPPFVVPIGKDRSIQLPHIAWPEGSGVNPNALEAKLQKIPAGYDPKTYTDYRRKALEATTADIDAARAYGCLLELKSGPHDIDAWVTDPTWLADRIDQKLDRAVKSAERRKTAADKKSTGQAGEEVVKDAAADKNAKAKADMLAARERNLTLGRALYKEMHAPKITPSGMRAIAELIVDYAGDDLGQRGLRFVDESAQTVTTKKNGDISKVTYPRTQQQCRDHVRRQLARAKTTEQIYGFLLQLLMAGRFAEVEAAPQSDRWGSIRSLDGYSRNRVLLELVDELAEPVLPPAVVEQLVERRAQYKRERELKHEQGLEHVRTGFHSCPNCGNGGTGAPETFAACDCSDADIKAAIEACPKCGEEECFASCSAFAEPVEVTDAE